MTTHQFASHLRDGMVLFTLATGLVSGWRGCYRLAWRSEARRMATGRFER